MKTNYYWTTIKQVNPGTKFKIHPDHVSEFIRGSYNRTMQKYECWHSSFGIQYLDGSEIVCVMRGE